MITGTYVNRGYENSPVSPNFADTLKLFEDYDFESKGIGKGRYKIFHTSKGTRIYFHIKDEYGNEGMNTYITRIWYGNPKIIMFMDLSHYYEKID